MRSFSTVGVVALFAASAALGAIVPQQRQDQAPLNAVPDVYRNLTEILGVDHRRLRLIELEPGVTKQVTEEEKWRLKLVICFCLTRVPFSY